MNKEQQAASSVIQILADLPEFLRKPMLQRRLGEFYSMDGAMQRDTIRLALAAAPGIPAGKLATLVKTWLEVLAEFEPSKRDVMFRMYCNAIEENPSILQRLDLQNLTDAFLSLPESKRTTLSDSLHEVLLSIHDPQRVLMHAPQRSLEALGLK